MIFLKRRLEKGDRGKGKGKGSFREWVERTELSGMDWSVDNERKQGRKEEEGEVLTKKWKVGY